MRNINYCKRVSKYMTITTESALIQAPTQKTYFYMSNTVPGTISGLTSPAFFGYGFGIGSAGYPSGFTLGSPGLSGAIVDGTTWTGGGIIPFVNAQSGQSSYLSGLNGNPTGTKVGAMDLQIYDLLWYNSGIVNSTTTAQTINSVTLPARDMNGATNGVGIMVYLVLTGAGTIPASTVITGTTISYTNSSGVSGRTGTIFNGFNSQTTTMSAGLMCPFMLQGADYGVQSIQSITLASSYASLTPILLMIREISSINYPNGVNAQRTNTAANYRADWLQLGFPQLYNGTAMAFKSNVIVSTGVGSYAIVGNITVAYG